MAEIRQKIRGTTAELDQVVGRLGLLAYDVTRKDMRIFDGVKQGGWKIYSELTLASAIAEAGYSAYNSERLGGQLPAYYAQSATRIEPGTGLTGGGDLSTTRVLNVHLGEFSDWDPQVLPMPSVRFFLMNGALENTQRRATAEQFRYALSVPSIAEFGARSVSAGGGLTGGGNLSSDRVISMGLPSAIYANSTNLVSGTSHTHQLVLTAADLAAIQGFSSARNIAAGVGLTGGGNLSADRTISMGAPSSVGRSTGNVASSGTHSHTVVLNREDVQAFLGFAPVIRGNGTGQQQNEIFIGWLANNKLGLQVDASNFGWRWPIDIAGFAERLWNANGAYEMNFSFAGFNGQPNWVWGSNNGYDQRVYNPVNFSVNDSLHLGGSYHTNYVKYTRGMYAGDGLTGGGTFDVDRAINMGAPSSITNYTANNFPAAGTHTHALGVKMAEVSPVTIPNEINFGIGHSILCFHNGPARNAVAVPCLDTANAGQYVFQGYGTAGTALAGTWRSRGSYGAPNTNGWVLLERVS